MKAAVVGLGIVGAEWARHLHSDGVLAATWNRTPKEEFYSYNSSLSEIPLKAEVIHIVVADPLAVASVVEGIAGTLSSKNIVIQSSTIDPKSAQQFSDKVSGTGALYLEAPFTGSLPAAQKRELVFYVGGSAETLRMAETYLAHLSKLRLHIGSIEQACTQKLVMNLQIASIMQALAEALATARASGISDQAFFEAFRGNASFSGVAALKEPKLKTQDFSPQFSVKHMAKDLRLLRKSFPERHFPFLDTLIACYESAEKQGLSEQDFSALIKLV